MAYTYNPDQQFPAYYYTGSNWLQNPMLNRDGFANLTRPIATEAQPLESLNVLTTYDSAYRIPAYLPSQPFAATDGLFPVIPQYNPIVQNLQQQQRFQDFLWPNVGFPQSVLQSRRPSWTFTTPVLI